MRIGFLIESLDVEAGGPARVAGLVASGLARRGHIVTIATLPSRGQIVHTHAEVRVTYLCGARRYSRNWMTASASIKRLAQEIDVLFVSGIWGPVDGLARRLAGIEHIPVHTRICGMLEDFILRRHPLRKWVARKAYVNANLNGSTSLIVNTEIEARHVRNLGFTTPIQVIPNGVDLPLPSEKLPRNRALQELGVEISDDTKVLLYLSRIHPKKCLHLLLDALPDVFCANPNWALIIAGDFYQGEDYEKRIRRIASSSAVANRIHFVGNVSEQRKSAAFSLTDLFVLPSQSEGFSNAVIEALAWGIPAIITTGCNFPEVEEYGAGWVCSPTAASLSAALKKALVLKTLQKESQSAQRLISTKYQQKLVLDLYEQTAMTGSSV